MNSCFSLFNDSFSTGDAGRVTTDDYPYSEQNTINCTHTWKPLKQLINFTEQSILKATVMQVKTYYKKTLIFELRLYNTKLVVLGTSLSNMPVCTILR